MFGGAILSMSMFGSRLTGIQIEITGAFLGVFAAIALGGMLNSATSIANAKQLIRNLNSELEIIETSHRGIVHFSNEIWDMAKATGDLNHLDDKLVKYLLATYQGILLYNGMVSQYNQLIFLNDEEKAIAARTELERLLTPVSERIMERIAEVRSILTAQL